MSSSDEESGPDPTQNNKKRVGDFYLTIVHVFLSIVAFLAIVFIVTCLLMTLTFRNDWIWSILLIFSIILCELVVWNIALDARKINEQEEWDDHTATKMRCYGVSYSLLVIGEIASVVGLMWNILVSSPKWFQNVTYLTLIMIFTFLSMTHFIFHTSGIYGQKTKGESW